MKKWYLTGIITIVISVLLITSNDYCSDDLLLLNEDLRLEKVILDEIDLNNANLGKYKTYLLETLKLNDWNNDDITLVQHYLNDHRAEFRPSLLKVNTTHQETKEQYTHQKASREVDRCMEFWKDKGVIISGISNYYGIPPEIVVSILKIESDFGRFKGREPVFNVFWNLSLSDHPEVLKEVLTEEAELRNEQKRRLLRRARWGRSELSVLIDLIKEGSDDRLLWTNGSWAGAFGLPQFIPSSYRAYAQDGDGDGNKDLDNIDDAAASIANYLKSNGWRGNVNRQKQKKVIMRYNISSHYADCILALADSINYRIKYPN
ncbi:MAG: lytic murein transglycosylase [Candidatus Hatepunaea meridiana]|nr:lytic murein transglycosylase [Candidatus Hatepunaea meridiana]